jgi:ATP-dependent Lon protease
VIDAYTREAGVRNLERELAALRRAIAVVVAEGREPKWKVEPGDLAAPLGPHRFWPEMAERTEVAGVATGLAWTEFGGEILFVEATRMPGQSKLILTGKLGDVMQESAHAALTFVRARAERWGLSDDFFETTDVHVHVPAGAMPKDGPSAGVAMITAMVSLFSGRPVRNDVAMTGEITLRGHILPIGGVKEKVLAAHRAGVRRVFLPERNKKDLVDIPEEIRKDMDLVTAEHVDQVIEQALEPAESKPALPPRRPPEPAASPSPAPAS